MLIALGLIGDTDQTKYRDDYYDGSCFLHAYQDTSRPLKIS